MSMEATVQKGQRLMEAKGEHLLNYFKNRLAEVEHLLASHMSVVLQLHEQLNKAEAWAAQLFEENRKLKDQLMQPQFSDKAR